MLEIDFIGYDGTHPAGFVYGLPKGHDSYLLLLTSTPVEISLAQENTHLEEQSLSVISPSASLLTATSQTVSSSGASSSAASSLTASSTGNSTFHRFPAGTAILYTPGSNVLYRACDGNYVNDWIRFHCDEAFVEQLPIKNQPFQVSDTEYCHDLFKLMTWESTLGSPESSDVLSHLMKALFLKLAESCSRPAANPHEQEMLDLRRRIYNHPEFSWSVNSMAQELHLSCGYLQALYKDMFGISCMEDVILQRLKHAQDQLSATSKPILEIAEDCGYNNVEHFCRQFRKFLGISPSRYRRDHAERLTVPKGNGSSHRTLGGSEAETGNNPLSSRFF